MIAFITFANTDSGFSLDRIRYEAEQMRVFDSIDTYTEKDIDEEYMSKYGDHFGPKYRRGYGYWAWKPYFIKKKFAEINEGDTVVYADCGCMLLSANKYKLLEWVDIASKSESGVLSPCFGPYLEREWTKGDLRDFINKKYNTEHVDIFDNAAQCGAGVVVMTKKEKSVEMVDRWNYVMSEHFHLCTDERSSAPNHPNFHENRHDQSVFSMLSKIYKIETIRTEEGILNKEVSPIVCTRIRGGNGSWKKPTKIFFDSQAFDMQTHGGVTRMFTEFYKELNKNEILDNFPQHVLACGKYQEFSSEFGVVMTKNEYLKKTKPYLDGNANNRLYSIDLMKGGDFDIFYPTFFDPYFLQHIGNKPFVLSVHDMIVELYPQLFTVKDVQTEYKRMLCEKAAAIEVPTNTTKRDLINFFGIPEEKITVIGRGLSTDFGADSGDLPEENRKYILYVGGRWGYKRFDWLCKHIKPFMDRHKDYILICTGQPFNQKEMANMTRYGFADRAHAGFVDDHYLGVLYKNAACFVSSSEYEGFGLPIIEAYKMGCPVLINGNDCHREVTLNRGEYFSMTENDSDLSERLEYVISMPRESSHKLGKEIVQMYTWKNVTDKLKNIFRNVANK